MNVVVNLWTLLGILVITLAFILRVNPMLAVIISAIVTAFAAKISLNDILVLLGNGFLKTRNLSLLIFLPLAAVGLMERHGLREKAQLLITNFKSITISKLLIIYLGLRQLSASVGLNSLGGQPQMVRPILAPMVEKILDTQYPNLDSPNRERFRALCAASDNVGLFYGEDIFVAFGAVALMSTFLHDHQIKVEMLNIALWGIPTACCAFFIHSLNIIYAERKAKKIQLNLKNGQAK
ncbi:MAG: DUF969 domain-containing protein [Burkholderiales bacterium]|nr:DUF969 domain-containing protein [Burkholderiales bacterium]